MPELISYLIYLSPILVVIVLCRGDLHYATHEAALFALIFAFCILGLREDVGYDYAHYTNFYYSEYFSPELLSKALLAITLPLDSHYWYIAIHGLITIFFIS